MATARKLPSDSWRVRVYVSDLKKYKSFTADSKKEAERAANEWLLEHEHELELQEDPTFKMAAEQYINARKAVLSPSTIAGYQMIVKNNIKRFENVQLSQLTPRMVQDWVNELTVSKSPKTVHNMYGFFTAVINYHDTPLRLSKITLPKKVRHFKRLPTAELVLETFRGTDIELPVLLAVWCGMRMSEILGIRYGDIDGDVLTINQVRIMVGREMITKSAAKTYNSNRQIRLAPEILKLIDMDLPSKQLVIGYNREQIFRRFTKRMEKLGYKMTFHDLRHVNASVMAALGIPDIYAMERGGWSNTTTLKSVYQQTFSDERQKVDNQIDSYFSKIYDTRYDTKKKRVRKTGA